MKWDSEYTDTEFPPDSSSLFTDEHLKPHSISLVTSYKTKVDKWLRPLQLVTNGERPSLWGTKGVIPNSVEQGKLGDHWFLSAAAALAEYPNRV